MTFLWFDEKVAPCERKRVQLDFQQALANAPVKIKEEDVLEKRPWNKAQAIFICAIREHANLPRDTFDTWWVKRGLRVSACHLPGVPLPYSLRLRRLRRHDLGVALLDNV